MIDLYDMLEIQGITCTRKFYKMDYELEGFGEETLQLVEAWKI